MDERLPVLGGPRDELRRELGRAGVVLDALYAVCSRCRVSKLLAVVRVR